MITEGMIVYFVQNAVFITKATVLSSGKEYAVIRLDGSKGGIRVRTSRLYLNEDDARRAVRENEKRHIIR